jgi:tRNA nucleotidyltransferase (CCA-adding enzyme)
MPSEKPCMQLATHPTKLLGLESADIDVALSTIMGLPFAESFIEYISSRGIEVSRIHLVQRNPDQSKHLETAKLSVLGFDLDFVNLRSETYAEDSRIPASIVCLCFRLDGAKY